MRMASGSVGTGELIGGGDGSGAGEAPALLISGGFTVTTRPCFFRQPARAQRPQRQLCVEGAAQRLGPLRVTAGLAEELLLKCCTRLGCSGGAVFGGTPR